MNITILGAGAIGSLWAYHLTKAGHTVSLMTRDTSQQSLTIALDSHQPIVLAANQQQQLEHCDLLLITVKAWQVKSALTPLLDSINPDTILMFMHNGMGAIDSMANSLARFPVVQATTTHGALITKNVTQKSPEQITVSHTGLGETQMGGYNAIGQRCDFLAEVLDHSLPNAHWHANITPLLWNKLAINCAINPLTAIHNCRNGQLANHEFAQTLRELCNELAEIMKSVHIEASSDSLLDKVNQVISATANNYSSMHQDIVNARPTELDYITGYVIKVANAQSIDVPVHQRLYNQLQQLDKYHHSSKTTS